LGILAWLKKLLSSPSSDGNRDILELLAREVPEIASGAVVIKGIARKPGKRTKIWVLTTQPEISAVSSVVGLRALHMRRIVAALGGEVVDVIPWSENETKRIKLLLAPANVGELTVDPVERKAVAVLRYEDPLTSLYLAAPENLELAIELSGYQIEIAEHENRAN
jgi:N utilization substance protein A